MIGLWWVSGRSDLDWEQAVRLDLCCGESTSLAIDLLILMHTIKVVDAADGTH